MIINVTQKHIDDAAKWAEENPKGGDVCGTCIAARAISDALGFPVLVDFTHAFDMNADTVGHSEEIRVITELSRNEWKNTKPFSFELEMINAG